MANRKQLSLLGVSAFCESMASMLDAGIDMAEAASLLKQKGKNSGQLNEGIGIIEESLNAGSSLKEAMEKSGMFPGYVLEMVDAGEATGKTEEVLKRLADYYAAQHSLSEKIKATIVYPLALIVLIIIVLFMMLKMVLPAFSDVYETLTGSLSESSYAYINYAYVFCRVALIVMSVLVAVVILSYFLYRAGMKKQIEKLMRIIPGCSSIMEDMALYRFTSAYEVFLSSGYLQDEAVEKAKTMADYEPVVKKIDAMQGLMSEGHGFAVAANETELYEPVYGRMLIPAERSGTSEDALRRLVDLLSESVMTGSDRLLGSLESILSGVLMITVAVALLCVMLPLIGIMNSIG